MSNPLPELYEGHAPITLHQLFREALEAYDDWIDGTDVPRAYHQGNPISINAVFEHMRGCTDILPHNMVSAITERLNKPWSRDNPLDEMSFSTAARIMCLLVRKRQARRADDIGVFMHRLERLRPGHTER